MPADEELFRIISYEIPVGILVIDTTGEILYENPAARSILDMDDTIEVSEISTIVHGIIQEFLELFVPSLHECAVDREFFFREWNLITRRNKKIWVECLGRLIHFKGSMAVLVSLRDITQQKQIMETLQESETKFVTVFRNSPIPLTLVSVVDGSLVDVNDAFVLDSGYTREEVIGKDGEILDFFPDVNERDQLFMTHQKGECAHGMEIKIRKKGGEIKQARISTAIIQLDGIPHILSTIEDITSYKKMEDAIRESEEKFRMLVDLSLDGIVILDLNGMFLFGNKAIETMFEIEDPKILVDGSHSIFEFLSPSLQEQIFSGINAGYEDKKPDAMNFQATTITGRNIWVEVMGIHFLFRNSPAIFLSVRDVTQRKQMELSLQEANQKLKFLTRITRHDLVNDLSIISLSLDAAKKTTDPEIIQTLIQNALDAGKKLEKTIAFTHEYEHFGSMSLQWISLRSIIDNARSDISITDTLVDLSLSSDLEIHTDPIIRKVFTTLFENSIRHGGTISTITISAQKREEHLVIIYEDDGTGISKKDKERIFHHGYGKHKGIGLFLAREILSVTGLSIRETGQPGKGTRFEIFVPQGMFRYSPR